MRWLVIVCVGAMALGGCENVDIDDSDNITRADVEAIGEGSGEGVVFSGTWVMEYTVTESTCGALELPEGFPDSPPIEGREGSEEEILVQTNGALTRGIDDVGEAYLFKGSVDLDGAFEYGIYFTLGGVERIEIVEGDMDVADDGEATLTATSTRRYVAGIFSCEATLRFDGIRTAVGEPD